MVTGGGDTIMGDLRFDSRLLEVQSFSEDRSIVGMWAPGGRPSYSNFEGTISFSGGVPGGVRGSGTLFTINFRAKEPGSASISFSGGDILEYGNSILSGMGSATYIIRESSAPTPVEPGLVPILPDIDFGDEPDVSLPDLFFVEIDNGGDQTEPSPFLIFTEDPDLPETDHYEIILDQRLNEIVSAEQLDDGRYRLPPLPPGQYSLEVRAFDREGGSVSAFVDLTIIPIRLDIGKINLPGVEEAPLTIPGTTVPGATVRAYLAKIGNDPEIFEVSADDEGNFVFARSLLAGSYQIWFEAEDQRGALSGPTEKMDVEISFGGWAVILVSILSALILVGGCLILVLHRRIRGKRMVDEKAEKEADLKEDSVNAMEEKIKEQIRRLEGKPDRNRSEARLLKELKETLDSSREDNRDR